MASDNDDPFAPADGTVLRPRPGGRRSGGDARAPEAPASPAAGTRDFTRDERSPGSAELADFVARGRNPILQAAAPLLAIAARLQSSVAQADVSSLRSQAMQQVRQFDDRLRSANVAPEDAVVARYVLCTFFDSAVLNTPWGANSDWSGQSLLIVFHKEKSGGEKFFQILERLNSDPRRYINLIELQYVCLALGYEGRYRLEERGAERLAELQHGLFRTIRETRRLQDEELSPQWRGVEDKRNPILRYVPWWIVAASALAVLAIAFVIYDARLKSAAAPIKEILAASAVPMQYSAPPAPRVGRLKQLLAPEEAAGHLTVEDFGDKAVVTLTASDLFRSGSAQVNPVHQGTLRAVAQALNQVPGRVYVVGHTDDQPVRSLQYADNFELSRERAVAVASLMKGTIDNFGRIEWLGAGSTQPRYKPVDTAENRARNRRVEIIQMADRK